MVTPNPSAPTPATLTTYDTADAGWAAGEIATLIRYVGGGTAAGMVLRQAQRELHSLSAPPAVAGTIGPAAGTTVVGPLRIQRAG